MDSTPRLFGKTVTRSALMLLRWISIILGSAITVILIIPIGMLLFGYKVNADSSAVAELAAQKKDISICRRIINYGIFGPQSGESRAHCIHEYAKLTHDPSACELLMPSEYGLSCINDVISQEYENHMESGFFEWEECSKPQSDPLRLDWCDFLRAHRNRSAADCSPIRNEIIRTGCTLKFEAWEQYPELRSSFYFGKATQ